MFYGSGLRKAHLTQVRECGLLCFPGSGLMERFIYREFIRINTFGRRESDRIRQGMI